MPSLGGLGTALSAHSLGVLAPNGTCFYTAQLASIHVLSCPRYFVIIAKTAKTAKTFRSLLPSCPDFCVNVKGALAPGDFRTGVSSSRTSISFFCPSANSVKTRFNGGSLSSPVSPQFRCAHLLKENPAPVSSHQPLHACA